MYANDNNAGAASMEVRNPATDEVIGKWTASTPAEVDAAVAAARSAQKDWEELGDSARVALLLRIADRIEAQSAELSECLVKENGRPLNPAGIGTLYEVYCCAKWIRASCSFQLPVEHIEGRTEGFRYELHRIPIGVVAAIVPWNWPLITTTWSIMEALRMGNTVVLKPSEYTTLCTLKLAAVFQEVLPRDVLRVVCGAGDVGQHIVAHEGVDKVTFTGSTKTGRAIAMCMAKRLAPVTLELGGNDAAIVLPGADVAAISQRLFWAAFTNSGQTCIAIKRLYVHSSIYEQVVDALAAIARAAPMGNGMDDGVVLGPLQNRMQLEVVSLLVDDAKANGARIVTGGKRLDSKGLFYEATIVADIENDARLVKEEQFGPALPIIKYDDVDDAVAKANALNVGLGASVWGAEEAECEKIAHRMQAGTVWVNSHAIVDPMVPFFGIKQSGMGVEFGLDGLKNMSTMKVLSFNVKTTDKN